jgi:hypothetical protein
MANSLEISFEFHAKFDGKNCINYREKDGHTDIVIVMEIIVKLFGENT